MSKSSSRWWIAIAVAVLGVMGSAWGYTLLMSGRVTRCETLVEVQAHDITDIVTEQKAMRKDFNREQLTTRELMKEMWVDLKEKPE